MAEKKTKICTVEKPKIKKKYIQQNIQWFSNEWEIGRSEGELQVRELSNYVVPSR